MEKTLQEGYHLCMHENRTLPIQIPLSKALLKKFGSLLRKKYRSKHQLFIAEGARTVEQFLIRMKPAVEAVIVSTDFEGDDFYSAICAAHQIPVYSCTSESFRQLSDTANPQGILAVCKCMSPGLSGNTPLPNGSLYLALDDLQDPGNLGTIYRTAAWFGVSGLLLGTGCADFYNPKVIRSTAGATGTLPFSETDLLTALPRFEARGAEILLLDLNPGARPLHEVAGNRAGLKKESRSPLLLVTGNEARGISQALRERYPAVYIQGMPEQVESLNAAISTAIALYALTDPESLNQG
ncbi:TrmH family RNA methyltransferase [Cyclonatronum proteinivorum]|uniref:TrmH family RNA methyltransferase n=1 Tax=Cyclonatronum proteinivorum TaxID=1457365 RepID=UPI0013DEC68D|nr:RNA methyltransferase [Cyclonatronum proteinivorum]